MGNQNVQAIGNAGIPSRPIKEMAQTRSTFTCLSMPILGQPKIQSWRSDVEVQRRFLGDPYQKYY